MAERVTAPDGREWIVRRRLAPRLGSETLWSRFRRRFRSTVERLADVGDPASGCLDASGEGIVVAILVVVVALVAIFVLLPLLVALVEVIGLLLLAVLGIVARIVLRRPWTVEALADDGTVHRLRVVGWRAGGERVLELAQQLEAGVLPPLGPPARLDDDA